MVKRPSPLLVFIILIPVIFFLESKLLAPHLKYGFADVDWGFLYSYKQLGKAPLLKISQIWQQWGVYTYQAYYIGIIEHFFPIDNFNFIGIHQVTNFFKFLSAITLFPLIYILTGKKLLSAITTLLYAVAYPAVGPLYAEAVSGNYLAIAVMNLFLTFYIYTVKNTKIGVIWLSISTFLFLLTLFLSTERMFPLIPLLILGELFWVWSQKFSRFQVKASIIRASIFSSPVIIMAFLNILGITSSSGGAPFFLGNTFSLFQKISQGNWSLILYPFISVGSLLLPREYWWLIGSVRGSMESFLSYWEFFLGPFLGSLFLISVLSYFISKKRARFLWLNALLAATLGSMVFVFSTHHLSIDPSLRIHWDPMFLNPIIIAIFAVSLTIACLIEYVTSEKKEIYALYLFLGFFVSFLFIFLTWVAADSNLIFEGIHRYLAIPAIGSSFFVASLITLFYEKIHSINFLRNFAWVVLLVLMPIIQLDFNVVGKYFQKELYLAGMDGEGHIRMKSKLLSYMGNFDLKEPTLFYFDERDYENGYFDETTIIAAFEVWLRFRGKSDPLMDGPYIQYIRNGSLCPQPDPDCYKKLGEFVVNRNGTKGLIYKGVFYPEKNFYAFRLKNHDIYNIKDELVKEINLK